MLAEIVIDWPTVADHLVQSLTTFSLLLGPGILLYIKARAALIQGQANALKAEQAATEAVKAKEAATALKEDVAANTELTQGLAEKMEEVKRSVNGVTDARVASAHAQGVAEGKIQAKG